MRKLACINLRIPFSSLVEMGFWTPALLSMYGGFGILRNMEIDIIVDLAKKIGKGLMKKVITSTNITFQYNWDEFRSDSFANALAALSPADSDAVSEKCAVIDGLRSKPNNRAVMLYYLKEKASIPADVAGEIDGFPTVKVAAVCASVLDKDDIRTLMGRFFVNVRHGNDWKNFEVVISDDVEEDAVANHKNQLVRKLKKYVSDKENCAEHCESSVFRVESRQVLVLKLTDHADQVESWDNSKGAFDYKDIVPSMKLAVVLDDMSDRVSVHYRDGSVAKDILKIFCDEVLGANGYSISGEVKYDLDCFAKKSQACLGDTPSENGRQPLVRKITVVELYVWLGGSKNSRRTYFERDKDIYDEIRREKSMLNSSPVGTGDQAQSVFPVGTVVKRVGLRIEYDAPKRPNARRTIELMPNTDNGLGDMPREASDALRKFLEDRQILIKEDVADDGNDSGQNR